jgi:DNA-binding NarL/FixJ family response regulator
MAADDEGTVRILVVDDHAVVRSGLRAFLNGEPDLYVVGAAADGMEALDELQRLDAVGRRPQVVVMDLKMEAGDGIEATRRIRERYDDVKVVVLTSFGEEERVRAALRAGASGFLLKDADADAVALAVRAAHRGEVQLDPAIAGRLAVSLLGVGRDEPPKDLTPREVEVLRLVGAGKPNKAIATTLGISERTVRSHVSSILAKLKLTSRTQAALWAAREGILDADADRAPGVASTGA